MHKSELSDALYYLVERLFMKECMISTVENYSLHLLLIPITNSRVLSIKRISIPSLTRLVLFSLRIVLVFLFSLIFFPSR